MRSYHRDVFHYFIVGLLTVAVGVFLDVTGMTQAEETPLLQTCNCDISDRYSYPAHVDEVYDGDTVTVTIELGMGVFLHDQKIRLYGIDTPELRGEEREEGIKVRDWMRERVLGRDIVLVTQEDKKGKYGRWLGSLYIDGVNVNEELVVMGMAKEVTY